MGRQKIFLVNGSWNKRFRYKEDSLVTDVSLKKPDLQIELQIQDGVHHFHDVFLRKVTVRNAAEKDREVRLFFSHDLHLSDTDKCARAALIFHPA